MSTMTSTRKTIARDLPNGDHLHITAEERDGSSGLSAGFSITVQGWEKRGTVTGRSRENTARDIDFGGADHDSILAAAPELAPIVAAHLADQAGTPMHAEANGWYFYSGAHVAYELKNYGQSYIDRHGTPHERAARSLHIGPDELPEGLDREGFSSFVRSLPDRWATQAQAARDAIAAMNHGEGCSLI